MSFSINLIERGQPHVVSPQEWQQYELEIPMRELSGLRIVRLIRSTAGIIVTPGNHVGDMRLPDAALRISPKSSELMAAMEDMALRVRSRSAHHYERHSVGDGEMGLEMGTAFVSALLACIQDGVPWTYEAASEVTSRPRGRFLIGATLRLLTNRGAQHRAVVQYPTHRQHTGLVRVVRAAHTSLPGLIRAQTSTLVQAQTLIGALDEAPAFASLKEAIGEAERLLSNPSSLGRSGTELVARSLDVLLRQAALASQVRIVQGGIARFIDLEELWERCVLLMTERTSAFLQDGRVALFHGLAGTAVKLFKDGGPALDPDVIVSDANGVTAVIDAKYKSLGGGLTASASDMYQLTCYVQRTKARMGLLVHFSEEHARATFLGTTDEGAMILSFVVSPELLLSHGENAISRLLDGHSDIAKRVQECCANSSS